MSKNRIHSTEELEKYILMFMDGISHRELKHKHGLKLSAGRFREYVKRYEAHGLAGIMYTGDNKYSPEFKEKVVKEYLNTGTSMKNLAVKYNIPNHSTVNNWILRYTRGSDAVKSKLPEVYTLKGKTKTYEEKLAIVKDYFDNDLSYREAAEKHGVSYNNIYSWVQKYNENGEAGLIDGRGRGKPKELLSTEDELKRELKEKDMIIEQLTMENDVLKNYNK